jgi:uncharacterized integral membrane protein
MTKTAGEKQRPGTRLIIIGIVVLVLGLVLLLINLTNPVTNYVAGVGMVTTKAPSVGAIILLIGGLLLAGIGFGKRVLAAIEK